jgi:SAM-dependent methyltransferase
MTEQAIRGPLYSIPETLVRAYTMNGHVPIQLFFFCGDSGASELRWSTESYEHFQAEARRCIEGELPYRYHSDPYLIRLLKRHSIAGQSVLIIGSETPYFEALVSQFGGRPTTVEYRKIIQDIPGLETFTVDEFADSNRQFDCALSVSSIEHSGLGRYGDLLDPEADFKAMNKFRRHVKPGGMFFLQVPVGQDLVAWNAHRVYGAARLPHLLNGWEPIDAEGFDQSMFSRGALGDFDQPAFLLRNPALHP